LLLPEFRLKGETFFWSKIQDHHSVANHIHLQSQEVSPQSSRTHGDDIKAHVKNAVGKANKELIVFLSKTLKLPKSQLSDMLNP